MNIDGLRGYATLRNLNMGQAEKDYYQNMILFILYGKISDELVFKGGTALSKCYGINRFSEDLDFTAAGHLGVNGIVSNGLDDFGITHTVKEISSTGNSSKYRIKVQGPLFTGPEKTLCSITLDFSLREKVLAKPRIIQIGYHMDVLPVFDVFVMDEQEIFSEKIRALMTRTSARDLFDLVFLLRKGTKPDIAMVDKKLGPYSIKFNPDLLRSRCVLLEPSWKTELGSLVRHVPEFAEYRDEFLSWASNPIKS